MPNANISRFKIRRAAATRIVEKAAPMMKAKGVTSDPIGFCPLSLILEHPVPSLYPVAV